VISKVVQDFLFQSCIYESVFGRGGFQSKEVGSTLRPLVFVDARVRKEGTSSEAIMYREVREGESR
jgi:hypothetical protein